MRYLGIDIGGTAVKYGIVTEEGKVVCTGEYSVAFDGYETPILHTVLKSSREFLEAFQVNMDELKGIGVSATGQIDTYRGIVAGVGGNIKNWEGSDIKGALEFEYRLPVTVVNDANCVVLGEKWIGAAQGYKNIIVITVGTGIGGGIMVNNEVLLGSNGFAGELGHFSIDRNGRRCTCGNYGCYEQYASMTALIRRVKEKVHTTEEINGKWIFEQVKCKRPMVTEIVEDWILDISTGLVSLTHIFNPEIILIGGGVSAQEEFFVSKVRSQVKQKVMYQFGKNLKIEKAALGNRAGLVGAVYYLLNQEAKR